MSRMHSLQYLQWTEKTWTVVFCDLILLNHGPPHLGVEAVEVAAGAVEVVLVVEEVVLVVEEEGEVALVAEVEGEVSSFVIFVSIYPLK